MENDEERPDRIPIGLTSEPTAGEADVGEWPPPPPVRRIPSLRRATRLFLLTFLLLVCIGSFAQYLNLRLGIIFTEVGLLLVPTLWFIRKDGARAADFLRLRPVGPGILAATLALSLAAYGVAANLEHLVLTIFPPPEFWTETMKEFVHDLFLFDTWYGSVLSLLGLVVLAGICEEVLFRGYLQPSFVHHWGTAAGIVATAALFAAVHLDPWGFVARMFLGVWLGILALRTGSLLPAMLAHGTNNLLSLLLTNFAPQVEKGVGSFQATAISVLCFCGGLYLFHRWIGKRGEGTSGGSPAPA